MVHMKPLSIPNFSSNTFAIGDKQFVVHEALLTIVSSAVNSPSFTPKTIVLMSPEAGALSATFLAPALMCLPMPSASRKKPVDSITTSIPSSAQGKVSGSR